MATFATMKRLALLLSLFFLTLACKDEKVKRANVLEFLPNSAVLIAEVNDYRDYQDFSAKAVPGLIQDWPQFKQARQYFSFFFDSLEVRSFLSDRRFFLSLCLSGADKYDLLFISEGNANFEKDLSDHWAKRFNTENFEYSGEKIYRFSDAKTNRQLFVSTPSGLLIISPKKTLIQEAIRQGQSEISTLLSEGFDDLMATANQSDPLHLYLRLSKAGDLFKSLNRNWKKPLGSQFGAWAQIDLQASENDLLISGLLKYAADQAFFPETFKEISPGESAAAKVIPQNFSLWMSYHFNNPGQYYRAYLKYLESAGKLNEHQLLVAKLPPQSPKLMELWLDNEMGIFYAGQSDSRHQLFAYLRHRGAEETTRRALSDHIDSSFTDGHRGYIIQKLGSLNLLSRLYGDLFKELHQPYFCILDEVVLLCEDLSALKIVINDILEGKTLAQLQSYRDLQEDLPGEAHIRLLLANPAFLDLAQEKAPAFREEINAYRDSLSTLRWSMLQLKALDQGALVSGILRKQKQSEALVNRQWTTALGEGLRGKPYRLKNHRSGKYDLAIVDQNDVLHYLNHRGSVQWKLPLDGPVLGPIRQVDAFKNGKYQIVFNTARRLYLVDILGRTVGDFPVELPGEASAPLSVFDYDQVRKYRLVVPVGKKLLNYNIKGQLVPGWRFKEAETQLVTMPQHFMVDNLDVITISGEDGKIFLLNRRGEERFQVDQKLPGLVSDFSLIPASKMKKSELMALHENGKIVSMRPQGRAESLYLDPTKPADHLTFRDGKYLFSHEEELILKDTIQPFSAAFEGDISADPQMIKWKGNYYYAAWSKEAEEIRVFDQKGELLPGFPVYAKGDFAFGPLDGSGRLFVVGYDEEGTVICYLVNTNA